MDYDVYSLVTRIALTETIYIAVDFIFKKNHAFKIYKAILK